ncbi:hypothetical protein [Actinophytocola sp.]|uniref:hypothetical protein n=1 Tax=Actinophytocola sp. TaxID=1872138 RepID=UPI00389A703A
MPDPQYGFLVQLSQAKYDDHVHNLGATIVYPGPDGRLLSPSEPPPPSAGLYLTGFQVSAFLSASEERAWGYFQGYSTPYRVDRVVAEAMVRTLRKLDKGLDKATQHQGHVKGFDDYLFRIAGILDTQTYYVRSTPERLAVTGERFRQLTAPAMQSWLADLEARFARRVQ